MKHLFISAVLVTGGGLAALYLYKRYSKSKCACASSTAPSTATPSTTAASPIQSQTSILSNAHMVAEDILGKAEIGVSNFFGSVKKTFTSPAMGAGTV